MAFSKKISVNETGDTVNAIATLNGRLVDVYEGEKRNYATIRTQRGKYYDDFSVSFDKSVELPDGETPCQVTAEISTFFDKTINRSKTVLTGFSFLVIDK